MIPSYIQQAKVLTCLMLSFNVLRMIWLVDAVVYCLNVLGVIGVVKAGAYGHGSIYISKHLKKIGVERLAVATLAEGMYLRKHSIPGPIHVFGKDQDTNL